MAPIAGLETKLGKLSLKTPVLVASGTFGAGREGSSFLKLDQLGGIITKSMTV